MCARLSACARLTMFTLALASVGAACASGVPTPVDAAHEGDASDAVASADGAGTDVPACPPAATPTLPPACAALRELANRANAVTLREGGGMAFRASNLVPIANPRRAACPPGDWEDGADARVRFTAPAGGRWRFIASGSSLVNLLGAPGLCDGVLTCTDGFGFQGEHLADSMTRDWEMQRGESMELLIDGCQAGASCEYTLTAERIADLACPVRANYDPCAARQRCRIDPCDAERFECIAVRPPRLTEIRVLSNASGDGYTVGRAEDGGADAGAYLMLRWFDASGARINDYASGSIPTDGSEFIRRGPPRNAVRARVWFYDEADLEGRNGRDVEVTPWSPRAVGDACAMDPFIERCAAGLRCDLGAGATQGRCAVVPTLEITRLRAWYDAETESVRVAVEGHSVGDIVSQVAVEMLDSAGESLASTQNLSISSRQEFPSLVPFTAVFTLPNRPRLSNAGTAPGVARIRVKARDTASRVSAPVEAVVVPSTVVGLGGTCDALEFGCSAGLLCTARESSLPVMRCEPRFAMQPCDYNPAGPSWSPPSAGVFTLTGWTDGLGGYSECLGGRVLGESRLEIVAPTSGTYSFDLTGGLAIQIVHSCMAATPERECLRAPMGETATHLEVSLAAGERTLMTVIGPSGRTRFGLQVRVP